MGKHNSASRYRSGQPRGKHAAPSRGVARVAGLSASAALITVGSVLQPATASADESQILKLKELINCESGGSPTAKNPHSSASGVWQIVDSTWIANGGGQFAPTARQATLVEQNTVAVRVSKTQGAGAWECAPAGLRSPFDPSDVAVATGVGVIPVVVDPVPAARKEAARVTPHVGHAAELAPPAAALTPLGAALTPLTGDYTIVPGDTLSELALRTTDHDWVHLYDRNRDVVGGNPDLIYPGQVLDI